MPIKETTKRIHFIPYYPKKGRQKDLSDTPTVNVFAKAGRIQFGRIACQQMQMEGKFVRFYYEPIKKIIGWKVTDQVDQREMKLWKVCRPHNNGVWQVSINRMLDQFQGRDKLEVVYKNLPIQKYRNIEMMALPNDTYFYIELKKEEVV